MKSTKVAIGDTALAAQYNNLFDDAKGGGFLLGHEQTSPNMTLKIEPGIAYIGATRVDYAGGNSPTITAPSTNPRIDLITIDNAGTIAVVGGVEAASPSVPAYPANKLVICEIYLRVGSTQIRDTDQGSNAYILRDVRPFLGGAYIASDAQVDAAAAIQISKLRKNSDFNPETDNSYDLGSSSFQWREVRAKKFFADGIEVGGGVAIAGTAGENLTAGKPAYVDPLDGKVYHAHGGKDNSSTSITISNTSITGFKRLNDTQFVMLQYNGSTTLTVYVFNDSGSLAASATVATNFQTSGHNDQSPNAAVARISDTKFIVFWVNTSNAMRFRTGTISGGSITMDTDTAFISGFTNQPSNLSTANSLVDNKCLFAFDDRPDTTSGTHTLYLYYLDVNTNSCTSTYSNAFGVSSGSFFPDTKWTNCVMLGNGIAMGFYFYSDGGNGRYLRILSIDTYDGTTKDTGSIPYLINGDWKYDASLAEGKRPSIAGMFNEAVFAYFLKDVGTGAGEAMYRFTLFYATPNGIRAETHSTYQDSQFSGGSDSVENVSAIGNHHSVIFMSQNAGIGLYYVYHQGKVYPFMRYGTNPEPNTQWDWVILGAKKDQAYLRSGSTLYKRIFPTRFDGIVGGTVSSGAAASLKRGYITGLSGLTANSDVHLKDEYSADGDTDRMGAIPIGRSLSTTTMLTQM